MAYLDTPAPVEAPRLHHCYAAAGTSDHHHDDPAAAVGAAAAGRCHRHSQPQLTV
jgi:hypothetical protein